MLPVVDRSSPMTIPGVREAVAAHVAASVGRSSPSLGIPVDGVRITDAVPVRAHTCDCRRVLQLFPFSLTCEQRLDVSSDLYRIVRRR